MSGVIASSSPLPVSLPWITIFSHDALFAKIFVSFNSNTTNATSGTGTDNPSGSREFTPCFCGVHVVQSLVFSLVFCRSFFVLLSFFFWLLYSMSSVLRLLITALVSSNFSYRTNNTKSPKALLYFLQSKNSSKICCFAASCPYCKTKL